MFSQQREGRRAGRQSEALGMKGPGKEGPDRNEAGRTGLPSPSPSPGEATLARKSFQTGWCLPILCQGQPRRQQRTSESSATGTSPSPAQKTNLGKSLQRLAVPTSNLETQTG